MHMTSAASYVRWNHFCGELLTLKQNQRNINAILLNKNVHSHTVVPARIVYEHKIFLASNSKLNKNLLCDTCTNLCDMASACINSFIVSGIHF